MSKATEFLQDNYMRGIPMKNMVLTSKEIIIEVTPGIVRTYSNYKGTTTDRKKDSLGSIEVSCMETLNCFSQATEGNKKIQYLIEFNVPTPFLDSRQKEFRN